jgi:hypothetical protein
LVCDGAGQCVECVNANTCPGGPDTNCSIRTCVNNMCGIALEDAGFVVTTLPAGDCKMRVCNETGMEVDANDNLDLPPTPSNQCAVAACNNGSPSFPAAPHGTTCSQDGGRTCDNATATCITSFSVLKYLATGDTAVAMVIEERKVDATGTLVRTTTLPTTDPVGQFQMVGHGDSGSEGSLALSGDGRYLILTGYDTNTGGGSPGPGDSNSIARVIGRIDAAGTIDSTTRLVPPATFSEDNIRGATSQDGEAFWATGAGSGSSGGIWYVTRGAQSGTRINTTLTSVRWPNVFGGQLYAASNGGIFYPNRIGTGLPTAAPAAAAALPGLPTSGTPSGYVFFDRNPNVDGPDLLYVADSASGSGIRRWTLQSNGGNWTQLVTGNFNVPAPASGFRGLTGYVNSTGDIVLIATTSVNAGNRIVTWTDVGGISTPMANGMTIVTGTSPQGYRGVAMSPHR